MSSHCEYSTPVWTIQPSGMLIFLVVWLIITSVKGGSFRDVENLYNNVMSGYNKHLRPLVYTDIPMTVQCSFQLVTIKELDEVNGKLSVVGFFDVQWQDARMVWNPFAYNHTYALDVPEDVIWTPEITLANPYESLTSLGRGFMTTRYYFDGNAIWYPGDVMSVSCPLDVTYYPFDEQVCKLQLICWGFFSSDISLITPKPQIQLDYYNEHGTWELTKTEATNVTTGYLSMIYMYLHMKRRSTFYVVNIILPVVFMIALNILVFVLPVESGERVSYSITVLLALAVFLTLVGETLPKTSKPMSILSYFLLADLILSALICVITIFGLYIFHRDTVTNPVPKWTKAIVRRRHCCGRCRRNNTTNVQVLAPPPQKISAPMGSVLKPGEVGVPLAPTKKSGKGGGTLAPAPNQEKGIAPVTVLYDDDDDSVSDENTEVTWAMVSEFYDDIMMWFSILLLVALKVAFFVITMLH